MMFLKEDEMKNLSKMGLTLKNGRIAVAGESNDESNLVYCGFNVYASPDGRVFEKQADFSMLENDSEEIRAEQRFIRKYRSED